MDVKDLLEKLKLAGLSPEAFELVQKELAEGQVQEDEEVKDEEEESSEVQEEGQEGSGEKEVEDEDVSDDSDDEEPKDEPDDEAKDDDKVEDEEEIVDDEEELTVEGAFKKLGVELTPEMAMGLAAALVYVKEQAEKHDAETKQDEMPVAEDSAEKIRKEIEKEVSKKAEAIDECRQVLGRVKFSAFDSAGAVYLAALKQMGKDVRGVTKTNAQVVFNALQAEGARRRREVAEDSARTKKPDALSALISKVKVSI